jgi:hypothetical protein
MPIAVRGFVLCSGVTIPFNDQQSIVYRLLLFLASLSTHSPLTLHSLSTHSPLTLHSLSTHLCLPQSAMSGRTGLIKQLVEEHKVPVDVTVPRVSCHSPSTPICLTHQHGSPIQKYGACTALVYAVWNGHEEAACYLVSHGANVHALDNGVGFILCACCAYCCW